VVLSSVGAHVPHGTGPIEGLYALEQRLSEACVDYTAVRAAFFMENLSLFVPSVRDRAALPSLLQSSLRVPMVATRDVGALAAELLRDPIRGVRVIELAGPSELSMSEIGDVFSRTLGRPIYLVEVPRKSRVAAFVQAGLPIPVARAYDDLYEGILAGRVAWEHDETARHIGVTRLEGIARALLGAGEPLPPPNHPHAA
jgi:uncharacterized protein YbjT (DUF2867 family)